MGEVWQAYDLKLRVDVALKTLRRELYRGAKAVERLRSEVRLAREVISPHVCRVFDLVTMDGQELVSMEFIDGETLLDLMKKKAPLGLREAQEVASQFLAGLDAIHQADLVHRDFKPENVMLTRTGRVVVMDFGIAKPAESAGTVSGTPAYMAPEQARGASVDGRADVYSAGVVLAEMVSEAGIRDLESRESVWSGVREEPVRLSDTPWRPVLKRAVARDPSARYHSAQALARALEEVTLRAEGGEEVTPYPGLAPFTEDDAEYFFGREAEVEAVWKKLRELHLLAIIGPSGAGKSSFLSAGLIPAMPEGWCSVSCHPGSSPFVAFAQALAPELAGDTEAVRQLVRIEEIDVALSMLAHWRKRHTETLVIVDQFEELFTLNPPEVQSRFAELLGRMAIEADVRVLLAMRDDFFLACHRHPALAPIFSEPTPLEAPTGAALRRALVQPALKCGYRFEDETLVDEMLGELGEERGALPLLAFAASRLWEKRDRDGGILTRQAHEDIGSVGGALAQHAETTLEKIGSNRLPIVREIFRNLVTSKGTRAARDREELLSVFEERDIAEDVLGELIDARLLISFEIAASEGQGAHHRVEIIHESLLSAWPRLVRWQAQDEDSTRLRDQLRQTAQLWQERGRPADLLWTGKSLREFQVWRENYPGGLSVTEEAFAGAMEQHAGRRKRRRRLAVAAVVAALVGGLSVVTVLWRQSIAETRRAEASKLLALGQLELERYPTAAVAHALKSLEFADTQEARFFALAALQKGPPGLIMNLLDTGVVGGAGLLLDFSPDGQWLALGGYELVHLRPRDGGAPVLFGESPKKVMMPVHVKFTPQGDRLVTSKQGEIRIYSLPEGKELVLREIDPLLTHLFMGTSGYYTVSEAESGVIVRAWPLDGGEPSWVHQMELEGLPPGKAYRSIWGKYAVEIDPAGKWFAYERDRQILLRSLEDWDLPPRILGEHSDRIENIVLLADGERIAIQDTSAEIRTWSPGTVSKEPMRVFPGTKQHGILFDGSGNTLADFGMTEAGSSVELWRLTAPLETEPLVLLDGSGNYLTDAAFDPSGRWLATTHVSFVTFWPLIRDYPLVLRGHQGTVYDVAFTPDGKQLISSSNDGTVRVWSLEDGRPSRVLLRSQELLFPAIDINPSGENVLVSGNRGKVFLVPLVGGSPTVLEGFSLDSNVVPVAFGPGGRLAAAASQRGPKEDKVIRVWDLESGECRILGPAEGAGDAYDGGYFSLAFLPDGRLLSWGGSGLLAWNIEDGTWSRLTADDICLPNRGCDMALSSDGQKVLYAAIRTQEDLLVVKRLKSMSLVEGHSRELESHGNVGPVAFDPTGSVAISGDTQGVIRVGSMTGDEPHLLLGHKKNLHSVVASPDGRWIASGGSDHTIRLWPMPDIDQQPFHTLPYEELLTRLATVTNLRVVEDGGSSTGYRLDYAPFPGWETVPEW